MTPSIAIVGLACRYPDANSPAELWENVLAQRRAFRRLPSERLRAEDYLSPDRHAPDRTYAAEAALIEGYEFDRVKFKVVGSTFRSADLAHWLALEVAAQAMADAGFADGHGLPRESTGVVLGNTLTGEFSRANLMRYRWPYVRRTLEAALQEEGWPMEKRASFLAELEARYKAPFPPVGEESLAGGLSNTIAGRICNHFDLKGGGYTVDGACASSLLAVTTACAALVEGDLDVALAGGVDLSLDPFEIVGFAKAGALAADEMRIYDARSEGFWPGEGCGFVTLMRYDEAVAQGRHVYATIRGWGVSSDGSGGLTRPEEDGQLLALRRAYRRAGFGIETVAYFEGHGTGTNVGDATELRTLTRARQEAMARADRLKPGLQTAAIGSIKGNIGHTKAAAGLAGVIKATMALHAQVLPPTTGCDEPHPELAGKAPALRVLRAAELWPADAPLRVGISAMGFGGINTHLVLEGAAAERRRSFTARECALWRGAQDAEVFLLAGHDAQDLRQQIEQLLSFAARLSRSELADLGAELAQRLAANEVRAAVVAWRPAELAKGLATLRSWLHEGVTRRLDFAAGVFLAEGQTAPRLGFLFPGQGSPANVDGGIHRRRFPSVDELYAAQGFPVHTDGVATDIAQPAIVTASLAGLRVLRALGIEANVGVGHSLGELTAYHWAGALDEAGLLRIAAARGRAMADLGDPTGAMASLETDEQNARALLNGEWVTVAGLNSRRQTVISGPAHEVAAVVERALAAGLRAVRLPVSHAFHSPLVAAATPALARQLSGESFRTLQRPVASTVTGTLLPGTADLRDLLCRQVTSPVRFIDAVCAAARNDKPGSSVEREGIDLWIEVGPGQVLRGLLEENGASAVVSLDAGGRSLRGLLRAAGAAFALGAPVNHAALFADRFTRPFKLDWRPKFFMNPCELAPVPEAVEAGGAEIEAQPSRAARAARLAADEAAEVRADSQSPIANCQCALASPEPTGAEGPSPIEPHASPINPSPLDLVRQLVAERTELPVTAIKDDSRMLSDLHLNSISVGQLVAEGARRLGLAPLVGLTEFANATVAKIAQALEELARTGNHRPADEKKHLPAGVDSWIRAFTVEWVEKQLKRNAANGRGRVSTATGGASATSDWRVIAAPDHPLPSALRKVFAEASGSGVIVCLPTSAAPSRSTEHAARSTAESTSIQLLLEGARAVLAMKNAPRFVLVQHGWNAGGFARTFHLENPDLTTCVVEVPPEHASAAEWVRAEALAADGFSEAQYDAAGTRREPRLKLLSLPKHASEPLPLGPEDVLLVTGGGKGIAAECALALVRRTDVRLALMGRSAPETDAELRANLERMMAAGVRCGYFVADVTDAAAVREAVAAAERDLGPITGVLHGAGTNVPQLISALEEDAFHRTLAPKIQGLRHVLAAVDSSRFRLLVTFGSIIARTGLPGEADYAVANEWLAGLTGRFQEAHPRCRCLAIEWSVWSGVGMGQRLGRIEALMQQGITPIPPDQGVEILLSLLSRPLPAASVVVTGRFGEPPTLRIERPELPFLRFLEHPRVHYPGVELVVDAGLSAETDPYVEDHVYHGERLFPAVLGLEAMAQAAMALVHASTPPSFANVKLSRPVVVAKGRKTTIRLAALARAPGEVEVALRSEQTGFQVDHFRVVCKFGKGEGARKREESHQHGVAGNGHTTQAAAGDLKSEISNLKSPLLRLDPARDLYAELLFHTGRFQRLLGYRLLRAKECVAEIKLDGGVAWFGRYLPADLALGDAGARDAAIHAIQACIPHRRLLPVGVEEISIQQAGGLVHARGPLLVHARERSREGDTFTYDMEILTEEGVELERWLGLRLRVVEPLRRETPWPVALLGPYVERCLEEVVPNARVSVAVEQCDDPRWPARSDHLFERVLSAGVRVRRRPDGRPETNGEQHVSASHAGDLTLVVTDAGPVACDAEAVTARASGVWRELLGGERFRLAGIIAREASEDFDAAATRVWVASECLTKAGAAVDAPLVFAGAAEAGWVRLGSGTLVIATLVTRVRDLAHGLAVGVLTGQVLDREENGALETAEAVPALARV